MARNIFLFLVFLSSCPSPCVEFSFLKWGQQKEVYLTCYKRTFEWCYLARKRQLILQFYLTGIFHCLHLNDVFDELRNCSQKPVTLLAAIYAYETMHIDIKSCFLRSSALIWTKMIITHFTWCSIKCNFHYSNVKLN